MDEEFEALVQAQKDKAAVQEQPTDEQRGYIDWWEFAPMGDTFIVHTKPDQTKKETESGIIFQTETDVIMDRPFKGTVVSVGPEAKFNVGEYVYFEPQKGMDLAMVRKPNPDEMYLLLYNEAIIGKRVKDTRK